MLVDLGLPQPTTSQYLLFAALLLLLWISVRVAIRFAIRISVGALIDPPDRHDGRVFVRMPVKSITDNPKEEFMPYLEIYDDIERKKNRFPEDKKFQLFTIDRKKEHIKTPGGLKFAGAWYARPGDKDIEICELSEKSPTIVIHALGHAEAIVIAEPPEFLCFRLRVNSNLEEERILHFHREKDDRWLINEKRKDRWISIPWQRA